jgi:hypothetical protein
MKLSMQVNMDSLVDLLKDTKRGVEWGNGEDQFYIQNPQFKQEDKDVSKPIAQVKVEDVPTPKKVKLKWGRL